jgi:4-amino-4-deoxy-L-arabinose transferase-like glycosyltransferase
VRRSLARFIVKIENNSGRIPAALALLALVLGVVYSFSLGEDLRYLPDEYDYVTLADSLAFRGSYSLDGSAPSAYRAPGYPAFLAPFRLAGAAIVHLRILNYVLFALTLLVVRSILIERASRLAAVLGVTFVLAYPLVFYTAGTLYPQTLATLLFLLALYFFSRREMQIKDFLLGGLLLGALILTVPTFAFTLLVFAVWLILIPSSRRLIGLFLVLAPVLLLVGAWTFRNYNAFNRIFMVSTNSGENLLLGNSEGTRPNAGTIVDISRYKEQAAGMGEADADAYYRDEALDWIRDNPGRAAGLYLQKVLNYFNFRNELVTQSEASPLRDLLVLLTYGPLLLILLARLALKRRFPLDPTEWLWIALYLLSALTTAVFFTRIRFRLPFDFLLILLAAASTALWLSAWSGATRRLLRSQPDQQPPARPQSPRRSSG